MTELQSSKCVTTYTIETLEMRYETQEEFDTHSKALSAQGWSREIYTHVYNFDTKVHESVWYIRKIEVADTKVVHAEVLHEALNEHKMTYVHKSENEVLQGNNKKAQLYNAKANAVKECMKLIGKM